MQKRHVLSTLCAAFALCAASALAAMPDGEFAKLCFPGTAAQVQQALKDGANPNARDARDPVSADPVLHSAARSDTEAADKVRALLAAGADVEARERRYGTTALMVAAVHNRIEVAAALLAAGAAVDGLDNTGQTALFHAAMNGNVPMIEVLLRAGAAVNARSEAGGTALIEAASNGQPEAVRALLAAGADAKLKDGNGDALWHARHPSEDADREGVAACVKLLQDAAKKPAKAAKAKAATPLVEVRHAPAVEGKTPVTLKATVPLTLTFHELDYEGDGPKLGGVTATVQLAAGKTHTFTHVQPFDMPVQGICAQPQQGERKCWFPQDNEADDGGRFIMAPGFALKN